MHPDSSGKQQQQFFTFMMAGKSHFFALTLLRQHCLLQGCQVSQVKKKWADNIAAKSQTVNKAMSKKKPKGFLLSLLTNFQTQYFEQKPSFSKLFYMDMGLSLRNQLGGPPLPRPRKRDIAPQENERERERESSLQHAGAPPETT